MIWTHESTEKLLHSNIYLSITSVSFWVEIPETVSSESRLVVLSVEISLQKLILFRKHRAEHFIATIFDWMNQMISGLNLRPNWMFLYRNKCMGLAGEFYGPWVSYD
jgi:hypothetical protein